MAGGRSAVPRFRGSLPAFGRFIATGPRALLIAAASCLVTGAARWCRGFNLETRPTPTPEADRRRERALVPSALATEPKGAVDDHRL
jgi:hypothetical protein